MRVLRLDAPSTLLGQLQRGLGRGWRGAIKKPRTAGDWVVECAARDPRWDHGVESRSYYYSTLLWMLEAPVDALHPDRLPTRQNEFTGEHWLSIEVLARLAARGREDAVSLLAAHLQGADYEVAVIELHQFNALEGRESLLWDNLSDEQVLALAEKWRRELPWDTWRSRNPRLQGLLGSTESVRDGEAAKPARDLTPSPSMQEPIHVLLEHAWPSVHPRQLVHRLTQELRDGEAEQLVNAVYNGSDMQRGLALWILSRLDDPRGVEEAVTHLEEIGATRATSVRYLTSLSATHTLHLARDWMTTTDGRYGVACSILARHSTEDDIPMLRHQLEGSWTERDFYATGDLIDALARHSGHGATELLFQVWEETEYSYCRGRIAEMFEAHEDVRDGLAIEGLWDCEETVRFAAVRTVDWAATGVRARFQEMAHDPQEDDDVTEAARLRHEQ